MKNLINALLNLPFKNYGVSMNILVADYDHSNTDGQPTNRMICSKELIGIFKKKKNALIEIKRLQEKFPSCLGVTFHLEHSPENKLSVFDDTHNLEVEHEFNRNCIVCSPIDSYNAFC